MRSREELEAEADRLMSLDDRGLEREAIIQGLRLGDISEDAMNQLEQLDAYFLKHLAGDGSELLGQGEEPP